LGADHSLKRQGRSVHSSGLCIAGTIRGACTMMTHINNISPSSDAL
jgi:hypothetical protein